MDPPEVIAHDTKVTWVRHGLAIRTRPTSCSGTYQGCSTTKSPSSYPTATATTDAPPTVTCRPPNPVTITPETTTADPVVDTPEACTRWGVPDVFDDLSARPFLCNEDTRTPVLRSPTDRFS
jgi:hypothetical protein